jgi:DNA-3-methyladenine glycosylase
MEGIDSGFFERSPVECARELIGCRFEWRGCAGRIVETEAYAAAGDEACHTFFRPSAREFVAGHPAGAAYIYLNYGVHWMFNILTLGPQGAGFVLFRALEPLDGLARMARRRGTCVPEQLCSGPGKLTRALAIDGDDHGRLFLGRRDCGIRPGKRVPVHSGPRIGINRATELPWRFGLAGSAHLSRPLKPARR